MNPIRTSLSHWEQLFHRGIKCFSLIQLDNLHSIASHEEIILSSYRVDSRRERDVGMKKRRRQENVAKK